MNYHLIYFAIFLSCIPGLAQEDRSNVQVYTPSALIYKDGFELNIFNNLYTQDKFNLDGNTIDLNERQTFYTGMFQFTYGVSENRRLNLGIDLHISSVRYDPDPNSSPLKVFGSDSASFRRTELSFIGPRVKFIPIQKWPRFSIQSSILFPIAQNPENPRFLSWDRVSWWNQFFYDHLMNDFQIFLQLDLLYRFESDNPEASEDQNRGFLEIPMSAFFSYFPGLNSTIFIFIQHNPVQQRLPENSDTTFARVRHYTQAGLGFKYQIMKLVGIEFSYANFFDARNAGLGHAFNLGIRYIH